MAKKGFRHNRLLDIKSLILNLKSMALRESEDVHRHRKERLGEIQEEKQAHLQNGDSNENNLEDAISTRDLQIRTWHTEQLNEDLRRQVNEVHLAEQEVTRRRKVVEKSAKEKQTLEKLKEHQDREARIESEREEQKRLDEMAGRKRSPSGE